MPFSNVDSGFDLELELSPLSLQQMVSQLFEQGIIEQTYFLDPNAPPTEQLTILIDPEAAREYAPNNNWQQPELTEDQVSAFQITCSHDGDFPGKLIVQVRLLIHLVTASLGAPIESSVEAFFHVTEELNTELLHLRAEGYREAYRDWLAIPITERGEAPTFGWEEYFHLHDVRFTDSGLDLPLVVNIVGRALANRQCDDLPAGPAQDECTEEVSNRDINFYFEQLLAGINEQIHSTLDADIRNTFNGLGTFLSNNQDSLQIIQLGRIGLNALPGGALGIYLNTRQKSSRGFYEDHGRGVVRNGESLRELTLNPTQPTESVFVETPGFVGFATAAGYLDRLLPDILQKVLIRTALDAGKIADEATANAQLLGDTLPLLIDDDNLGINLPVNLKIKRIRIRQKEKKFRLEEDGEKEKYTALEIKIDLNETAGKKLKLASNNLLIYLVPHIVYDSDERTNVLRCFVETNLRVDIASSFFSLSTLLGPFSLMISAITALVGKKAMVSEDLGKLIGIQIPSGLYPFKRRWDAFYETALGWLFSIDDIDVEGNWSEAQIRLRTKTAAQQQLLPLKDTELRSALPRDLDGNLTFEQLDIVNTDLLFRLSGRSLPTPLLPDLPAQFEADGTEIEFEQPIGTLSKPYFSYNQREATLEESDEEGVNDRVYRIPLTGSTGSLQSRLAYGAIEAPKFYFPVCALRNDSRIELLGIFSYAELEYFKEIVLEEKRIELIQAQAAKLASLLGKDLETISGEEASLLWEQAESMADASMELTQFRSNITTEAKARVAGHPEGLRLQVSPLTMASLIEMGYAVLLNYTIVRQSSGEVYLRNTPNDILSDNLEELPHCFQLHFPEELIPEE